MTVLAFCLVTVGSAIRWLGRLSLLKTPKAWKSLAIYIDRPG